MSDPRSPDWRDIGNQQPASVPSSNRPWQPGETAEPTKPASSQSLKRAIALLALVAILVGIGWVLVLLRKPKPAFLMAIGSGYEHNLLVPHNAHGWNGLRQLYNSEQIAPHEPFFPWGQPTGMNKKKDEPAIDWTKQSWGEIWKGMGVESKEQKTIVLILSLHGVAERDEVYLVPNVDSLEAFNRSRVPFKQVLESLKSVNNKNFVVLLDIGPLQINWPTGTWQYDFVERLESLYKQQLEDAGNLAVICSAGPGQRSWASDELQNSVFLHFVTRGLLGDALQGDTGVIKTRKLFEYVAGKVDDWARTNRARNQKPIMLGKDALGEVDLVFIGDATEGGNQAPDPKSFNPREIEADWQEWEGLKRLNPYVYNPHIWRLYQETLVRYEQLLRAGGPADKADTLKNNNLKSLVKQLKDSQALDQAFECLGNSFPMQQVLGYRSVVDSQNKVDLLEQYRKSTTADEKDQVIEQLKKNTPRDRQVLLVQLGRSLLKNPRTQDEDEKTLTELEVILNTERRPAELQLHKMLRKADRTMLADLLSQILAVRGQAEEVALSYQPGGGTVYSEVLFPRIRKSMEEADHQRREAEDLVFGDPVKHRIDARDASRNARKQYDDIHKRAQLWREAFAVRDEALADLPFLGQWLAFAPPGGAVARESADMKDAFETLGKKLIELVEIDKATEETPPATTVTAVKLQHQAIADQFRKAVTDLPAAPNQKNWHDFDHALSIPYTDAATRMRLLQQLQTIARGSSKGVGQAEAEEDARVRFERHRSIFVSTQPYEVEVNGAKLDKTNPRQFFKGMTENVPEFAETSGLDTKRLAEATGFCRVLPAGLLESVPSKPYHPVERLRRIQMHHLLRWQAERTQADHWLDGDIPYYLPVAKSYVSGAIKLIKEDERLSEKLIEKAEIYMKVNLSDARLTMPPSVKKQYWTTETDYPLPWKIEVNGVPKGKPMGWLEKDDGKTPLVSRQIIEWPAPNKTVVPFPSLSRAQVWGATNELRGSKISFQAHYRGQMLNSELDFEHPRVDLEVRQIPPPPEANLAVRMDTSFSYGAISIVLDTSGSMLWVPHGEVPPKAAEEARFDFAVRALKNVLTKLPDGTQLSVLRFAKDEAVKSGIGVQFIREPSPWQKTGKQRQEIENDLDFINKNREKQLKGVGSPIATAILRAMKQGFPANFTGPKVILVLSDGEDSELENDTGLADLQRVGVNRAGLEVVLVCFVQPNSKEHKKAKEQFKGAVKQLIAEPKGEELGDRLVEILFPRLQIADKISGANVATIEVGVEKLRWKSLDPKAYIGKIVHPDSVIADVLLKPGDNVFVIPKRKDGRYALERGLIGEQSETRKTLPPVQAREDWLVTLFKSTTTVNGNKLEQQLLFERQLGRKEAAIEQIYPGFVWLELDGASEDREGTFRWQNAWDIAAPAYHLERPNWPILEADPTSKAWFWPTDRASFLEKHASLVRVNVGESAIANKLLPQVQSADWDEKRKELIVRTVFEPGSPAMVLYPQPPEGMTVKHHYYRRAGRVTSYFTGLSGSTRSVELLLIDVGRFKTDRETLKAEFTTRIRPGIESPSQLR